MRKTLFRMCVVLLVVISIAASSTLSVFALQIDADDEVVLNPYTEAYVSETYNIDPSYAAFVQQKQQTAENYYNAIVSGNTDMALQYKAQFEQLSNPKLYQERLAQQVQTNSLASTSSLPVYFYISDLVQYPQETSYYCGCSAAKSILGELGISKSQSVLAQDTYLKADRYDGAPWYITDGSEFSQFPMATTLVNAQREISSAYFGYVPSPLGQAGTNPLTVDQCKSYIMSTTSAFDDGNGVAACGTSKPVEGYQLPGYPNRNIGHWIVCNGYLNNASYVYIVDPAKSSAVSWSSSIQAYNSISITLFRNFVSTRGIIW